jgi:serine protease AprX
LTGEGVKVCVVDTGIDLSNPAFSGVNVVFKDMIGDSSIPVDYGFLAHGTLMSGLLIAQSHQIGMSPNIQLGMVAALGDDGTGKNTADESDVAQAINWCIEIFRADIISLSLGGSQSDGMMREGPSASVTRKAVDMGIFVVAAAGNDGGVDDDGRVSVPSNVPRAISVGASTRGGDVWENSSLGSQTMPNGEQRNDPNMKPEIIAPGDGIISTGRGDSWYSSSGTSDATVFVTAALALILEDQPRMKPNSQSDGSCVDSVKEALRISTELRGQVHDDQSGYGQLHAGNWLSAVRSMPNC